MAKKGKKATKEEPSAQRQQAQGSADRAKTAGERRKDRIDGIKKTVYPSVLGILAGFACYHGTATIGQLPWHFVMVLVVLGTALIQRYTYTFLSIDSTGFQAKDWFYVEFMAVDLWLVTWTLLLN
ncbi:MAG: hypothetical protein QUS08_05745 [Methanothrix sp.]|nr:hypothetical protein [Methanothrix sp.]